LVKQTIKEKIRQRRSQMLVHSYIYYEKDDNIVSDFKWQEWADELRDLQNNHPDECNIGFYDKEFEGWTGAGGSHLPLRNPEVMDKAEKIILYNQAKV
tara:strand:- start:1808 stop:2101 length:294 start_codon:yes stop_codon:yes gene_type:complete